MRLHELLPRHVERETVWGAKLMGNRRPPPDIPRGRDDLVRVLGAQTIETEPRVRASPRDVLRGLSRAAIWHNQLRVLKTRIGVIYIVELVELVAAGMLR